MRAMPVTWPGGPRLLVLEDGRGVYEHDRAAVAGVTVAAPDGRRHFVPFDRPGAEYVFDWPHYTALFAPATPAEREEALRRYDAFPAVKLLVLGLIALAEATGKVPWVELPDGEGT